MSSKVVVVTLLSAIICTISFTMISAMICGKVKRFHCKQMSCTGQLYSTLSSNVDQTKAKKFIVVTGGVISGIGNRVA